MPMINFSNFYTILVAVILFILVCILSKEVKKGIIPAIMLFIFLGILLGHTVEFVFIQDKTLELYNALTTSFIFDFVFIFISFITYLWIDDIESKVGKKKSVDNSLDWFWKKV